MTKLISYNKWLAVYKPILEPGGYPIMFYTVDAVENYIKESNLNFETENGYHVWTEVDGDDGVCIMCSGWHWCNAMEYYITQNPWLEGEEINTYSAGGYECKIESIYEEIDCMNDCIKKGKSLDYYGHTKAEQEEHYKEMYLDDIAYCKEEIKRCNEMERKEFIPMEVL